jgi:hypothetical protein
MRRASLLVLVVVLNYGDISELWRMRHPKGVYVFLLAFFPAAIVGGWLAERVSIAPAPLLDLCLEWRPGILKAAKLVIAVAIAAALGEYALVQAYNKVALGAVSNAPLPLRVGALWIFARFYLNSAIVEETLYRLFLLPFLLWLQKTVRPGLKASLLCPAFWIANAVQAALFGWVHLVAHDDLRWLTWRVPVLQLFTLTQTWAGLVSGCLFARFGIEVVIAEHVLFNLLIASFPLSRLLRTA